MWWLEGHLFSEMLCLPRSQGTPLLMLTGPLTSSAAVMTFYLWKDGNFSREFADWKSREYLERNLFWELEGEKNQTKPKQTNTKPTITTTSSIKKKYIWRLACWVMLVISALTQDAETGGLVHFELSLGSAVSYWCLQATVETFWLCIQHQYGHMFQNPPSSQSYLYRYLSVGFSIEGEASCLL